MDGCIRLLRDIKVLGLGGVLNREILDRIEDVLRSEDKKEIIDIKKPLPENACPECGWLDNKHTKKCSKGDKT